MQPSRFTGPALALLLLWAPAARAQAGARLVEAQKAYAEVDYESTRAVAIAAIKQGGNDQATTSELYLLWAISAAALDRMDEARTAFSYALATNPELKLERSLSPKIRAPYLEARGAASTADGRAPLEVTLQRRKDQLELALRDTLQVAASIEFATRPADGEAFAIRRLEAAPRAFVATPNGSELQFFARVLDRYGNVLLGLGSADDPRRLILVSSRPAGGAVLEERSAQPNRTPYYATATLLGALGLAAGGAATALYLRREDAAHEWNGPGCERAGATRQQQCAAVDDRRQSAERLSIGLAATGSALLVGSLVTLLLTPSRTKPDVALDATPGSVMLRLETTL